MDINLFRRYLAGKQKIGLHEDHNGHAGIKNDFIHTDYTKLEDAKDATDADVSRVKAALKSVGAYDVTAKKDYNNIHAHAYLDWDSKLPFVIKLRMLVTRGNSRTDENKKYNVYYQYILVSREQGTPDFVKKYNPNEILYLDGDDGANVFIDDLKDLTPFPKSYISSKLSSWKSQFSKSKFNK